ncbi:MAG: hypothetical protein N2321_11905, partial [Melioribacteraceae bacterium]|nr:hypothetical protein [Melioribacteraceae bacterium]
MKISVRKIAAFVLSILILGQITMTAQTLVSDWGNTPRGTAWPILNTASTPAGNASYGADKRPSAWASIKGGFPTLTISTTQTVVVSGTFEMVGGTANNAYTWLRYALTFQENPVLNNKNTPTAAWTGGNHWGYEFTPRTGVGELANGVGGSGTVWTVNNAAGWNSTFTNNGGPLITVLQAPSRAVATAGVYDWAISVRRLADGTNEIRWYFVKQAAAGKQSDYWFAGIVIDKNPVTDKFNSICFANNNDLDETVKQVNFTKVTAGYGNPLTIPEAPWQAYYVESWGSTPRGSAWPILNTADFVVGNASMGADKRPSGWATIKGGFRETHK